MRPLLLLLVGLLGIGCQSQKDRLKGIPDSCHCSQ